MREICIYIEEADRKRYREKEKSGKFAAVLVI